MRDSSLERRVDLEDPSYRALVDELFCKADGRVGAPLKSQHKCQWMLAFKRLSIFAITLQGTGERLLKKYPLPAPNHQRRMLAMQRCFRRTTVTSHKPDCARTSMSSNTRVAPPVIERRVSAAFRSTVDTHVSRHRSDSCASS
jgi:hypothetical protein